MDGIPGRLETHGQKNRVGLAALIHTRVKGPEVPRKNGQKNKRRHLLRKLRDAERMRWEPEEAAGFTAVLPMPVLRLIFTRSSLVCFTAPAGLLSPPPARLPSLLGTGLQLSVYPLTASIWFPPSTPSIRAGNSAFPGAPQCLIRRC